MELKDVRNCTTAELMLEDLKDALDRIEEYYAWAEDDYYEKEYYWSNATKETDKTDWAAWMQYYKGKTNAYKMAEDILKQLINNYERKV